MLDYHVTSNADRYLQFIDYFTIDTISQMRPNVMITYEGLKG
jgi:hypothetical protein